jgi:hypothetical protein
MKGKTMVIIKKKNFILFLVHYRFILIRVQNLLQYYLKTLMFNSQLKREVTEDNKIWNIT